MNTENNAVESNNNAKPKGAAGNLMVGIQHRPSGKIYTFVTEMTDLKRGEWVVVEAEHGTSLGAVVVTPRPVAPEELPKDVRKVIRRASHEELNDKTVKYEKALEIFETFCKKVKEHNLQMKPLDAELTDGDKKVVLTFFAEERIDFRSLVKELASILRLRVEMRQVGARDEVKICGGLGVCGMVTCCSQHLRQFQSISIQMAKTQGLTPNPAKLTGICGKLKCCLAYENPIYAEIRQRLPKMGSIVSTPRGEGKVVDFDILQEQCVVRIEEGVEVKFSIGDIKPQGTTQAEPEKGKAEEREKRTERPPRPERSAKTEKPSDPDKGRPSRGRGSRRRKSKERTRSREKK